MEIMKRVNRILNDAEFQDCLLKNAACETERIYCRHDVTHLLDVARIAYILSLEERLALPKDVVYAAGLLHDTGRWREYREGADHAGASRAIAEGILNRCGYSEAELAEILGAIGAHRSRNSDSALSQLLYRADKLSRNCTLCPAIGTCKNFQDGEKPYLLY